MPPNSPPTSDWPNRVGKIVVEALLFSHVVSWKKFDAAVAVAVIEIGGCLATRTEPANASNGKDTADHIWATQIAHAVVNGLFEAGLITQQDSERATEIVAEEISTTLNLGDQPPG